jgi:hypothetical protein
MNCNFSLLRFMIADIQTRSPLIDDQPANLGSQVVAAASEARL